MAAWKATKDRAFLDQAFDWGRQHKWQVDTERMGANRLFCVHTWLELYFVKKDQAMIQPAIEWLDTSHPLSPAGAKRWYLEFGYPYADSLYGAPALAMLAKATGNSKYLEIMHAFFEDVTGELFDKESGLYYRDYRFMKGAAGINQLPAGTDYYRAKFHDAQLQRALASARNPDERTLIEKSDQEIAQRYPGKRTKNGKKIFWSRGNGWVFAGIARILEYLPKSEPKREQYVQVFRRMAAELMKRQGADGLWRPNLDDPDDVAVPETSGTGFFCYGLGWGINNRILDRREYLPAVKRAWAGLTQNVSPEGKVLWGQQVGAWPNPVNRDSTHEYVTGAFLLAGSEVYKLAGAR
jgi:rhamnogalacturonyl hydrolase YesR